MVRNILNQFKIRGRLLSDLKRFQVWPFQLSMLSPPHISLMFLTTSPHKPNICVYLMVSFVYSGLSFLVCFIFQFDVHTFCLQLFMYLSSLFYLYYVCPFVVHFSSFLPASASCALHMGMDVCTPFHQFELLTFTLSIFALL